MLQGMEAGSLTVEQFRVLPWMQKPIDIVLEDYGLMIEVDGAQHAHGSTGFGQAAAVHCRAPPEQHQRTYTALILLHTGHVGGADGRVGWGWIGLQQVGGRRAG